MLKTAVTGVGLLFMVVFLGITEVQGSDLGYRLQRDASYFVVAPRKIRPNQAMQMSVSLLRLYYDNINFRAVIRKDHEEICSASYLFTTTGTQLLKMWIPLSAEPGNYSLRVEGSVNEGIGGLIFENETRLVFDAKQTSIFIQTSKAMYRQGQKVYFRIMPVEPNLMSRSGSMDVFIVDDSGTVVRRWLSMQTNAGGVLDMSFQLSEQPRYGVWKVRVKAFGYVYEKTFEVHEFWITMLDVNVTAPHQIMDNEWAYGGLVVTNLTLGHPVRGTMKFKVEVRIPEKLRDPNVEYTWPTYETETRQYFGFSEFLVTLDELKAITTDKQLAGKELYFEAEVHDWFYDMTATGWAITAVYSSVLEIKLLGDSARSFKPNQTFDVYYAVVHKDGTKLNSNRRQITASGTEQSMSGKTSTFEKKFIIGDDGIGHLQHTPKPDAQFITIEAYYDTYSSQAVKMTAMRHFTPTNSFIFLTSATKNPMIDSYMVFTVNTNTLVDQVYYVITAGGNIVTSGSLMMTLSRQKTFSLALSRDMMPEAHIVVWHIFQDEVISDSMNFFINGTRINKVKMGINCGKDFSRDTIELNCEADPSSYVGYSAIEHELWTYGWHSFITEPDIVKETKTYDPLANGSFSFEWRLLEEQSELIHFQSPSYGIDANTTFEYAGLLVFTDANVTRVPHECNETLGWFPCMDGSCYFYDQRCDQIRQCIDGQDEMGCEFPQEDVFTPVRKRILLLARNYYQDGLWIWGGHFVKPDGRLDVKLYPTDEAEPWVIGGIGISKDLGFGIVHDFPRHQGTRDFFMRCEVPSSIVKGEQIGIKLALFNFWMQDLETIVTLHGSDKYKFIVVEDYGIVSSYNPRLKSGDIQTMVYLHQGMVMELRFPVLPVVDGCVDVTISAQNFIRTDRETARLCIQYDGVTNYLHTPFFIDLISSGSMVLPDLAVPVPERFIKPQERQHLYVPGSPEAFVGVVGDVVGPGLTTTAAVDAETALRKPFGSAEQNLYNFAYTLYNLKYLKATNQLRSEILKANLEFMNSYLQRQMGYINSDGSFSMFRDYLTYTPSTWLTSYVLRVFNDANEKDWELDFYIEVDLLNRMMLWVCKQQDTATGAFVEHAPAYDRKMWTNYTMIDGVMKGNNFSLTAYVLITLAKSVRVTGEAEVCKTRAMQRARQYLERFYLNMTDVYQIAVTAYALHLAGSSETSQIFNKLDKLKITGNYVYWANKPIPDNEVKMIDTIPYYQPRRWYDNEAYAVEATSYALLTYLRRTNWKECSPIMKWLQTMRNSYYAQASTQDSITALVALVEYAKLDTNRALYNVELSLDVTSMGNSSFKVKLSKDNWPDLQQIEVYPVWGSVRGRAQGTGLALMQLATQVNVEYSHQILPAAEEHYFDVELAEYTFSGRNFSIFNVKPCARWARPDISPRSGHAVLEMYVPTGYIATNDVLRAYARSGEVPTLHRVEQYGRKLVFYFDYLEAATRTCVNVRLDRWYPVANMTIQHKLRVFDYYEPGMHNTTLYNTWHLFNLHVCQVCASFQCPYCLYYNGSRILQVHWISQLIFFVLAFSLSQMIIS